MKAWKMAILAGCIAAGILVPTYLLTRTVPGAQEIPSISLYPEDFDRESSIGIRINSDGWVTWFDKLALPEEMIASRLGIAALDHAVYYANTSLGMKFLFQHEGAWYSNLNDLPADWIDIDVIIPEMMA